MVDYLRMVSYWRLKSSTFPNEMVACGRVKTCITVYFLAKANITQINEANNIDTAIA